MRVQFIIGLLSNSVGLQSFFKKKLYGFAVASLISQGVLAQAVLPDPLSLQQAFDFIDPNHPEIQLVAIAVETARQDTKLAQKKNHLKLYLDGRARWFEPGSSRSTFKDHDDHALRLIAEKPLYDGGEALAETAKGLSTQAASELQQQENIDRYRLVVMDKFFNVLLADLATANANEATASAFVRFSRRQDQRELGKVSDVDVLAAEDNYQTKRLRLITAEGRSRNTRRELALALNRPGQQPSDLIMPELAVHKRQLLAFDVLLDKVMNGNRQLAIFRHRLAVAKAKVAQVKAAYQPHVNARIERSNYTRDLSSADKWRAGVNFSVPLYDGGLSDIATRKALLQVNKITQQRQQQVFRLRTQVGNLVEQFNWLLAERQASDVFSDYRELYMDRARSLYEMEVKTDLGDAMIQVSASHLRDAKQQFEMALLLAKLNWLAGQPVMEWDAVSSQVDPIPSS